MSSETPKNHVSGPKDGDFRLSDAKLVKKSPQQIIADGADFTYFRQLRKDLRA